MIGYFLLSPFEKRIVDALMNGDAGAGDMAVNLSKVVGCTPQVLKNCLRIICRIYCIDSRKFVPHVRLVYLRAIELGLLREAV